jgi:hypothetical protein
MTEPTQEQIDTFKRAWHAADSEGLEGGRVAAGLRAVMASIEARAIREYRMALAGNLSAETWGLNEVLYDLGDWVDELEAW